MYDCEICGKKTDTLYIIDVEGVELTSCAKCAEGKDVVDTIGADEGKDAQRRTAAQRQQPVPEEEVVEGYGDMIRKARESMGLPLTVLAERINEKESTLNRVEHGRMLPTAALTKKLEKHLGIKLTMVPEPEKKTQSAGRPGPLTLGDAAERK